VLKKRSIQNAIVKVKKLAEAKLTKGTSADEFVEIADVDGFKVYVTAGKTIDSSASPLHENQRDVFMWIIEGKIEFEFENGKKTAVKSSEYFVLPKQLKHRCIFKELTIAIEGVYEKGLSPVIIL
jgi:quercetin dioxygenase-like cupin family protein